MCEQFIKMQRPPRIPLATTALYEAIKQIPACLHNAIYYEAPLTRDLVWASTRSNMLVKIVHMNHDGSRALCRKYSVHPRTSEAEPCNAEAPLYIDTNTLKPARVWIHTPDEKKDMNGRADTKTAKNTKPKFQYTGDELHSAPISPYMWGTSHPTTTLPHRPTSWAD